MLPIMIAMNALAHRPMEIDFEEFTSLIDASWAMTFIDAHDHKYEESNWEEIDRVGIRHCTIDDLYGYEAILGDTF